MQKALLYCESNDATWSTEMTEYVFRPVRVVKGKRVRARLFSGRYSLARGEKPVTVSLDTPDKGVARARLRKIIVDLQREREGLAVPASIRSAAASPLLALVAAYRVDLAARGLAERHVHDTIGRVSRIVRESGWGSL